MRYLIFICFLSCQFFVIANESVEKLHSKVQTLDKHEFSQYYRFIRKQPYFNREIDLWMRIKKCELNSDELGRLRYLIELSKKSSTISAYSRARSNFLISMFLRDNLLFEQALKYNYKSFLKGQKSDHNRDIIAERAGLYYELKKYKISFYNYKLLIQTFPLDSNMRGCFYNNLGNCQSAMEKNDEAIYYFKKAQKELPRNKNNFGYEVYYLAEGNIGFCLYKQKRYRESLACFEKSLAFYKISKKFSDNSFQAALHVILNKMALNQNYEPELNFVRQNIQNINNELEKINLIQILRKTIFDSIGAENQAYFKKIEYDVLQKNFAPQLKKQNAIVKLLIDERISLLKKENLAKQIRLKLVNKNLIFKSSLIISLIILVLIILYNMYKNQKLKVQKTKNELLIIKQQELIIEKEKNILENEMALQREKMQTLLINFNIKSDIEEQFLKKIKLMKKRKLSSIEDVLNEIQIGIQNLTEIDKRVYFSKIEENDTNRFLFQQLKSKHPCLSNNEISFCQYCFIGLSSKEISKITGQTEGAVRAYKHKIKQKLNLEANDDLSHYFKTLITVSLLEDDDLKKAI